MSVSVMVPTLLRPLTDGQKKVEAQGETVRHIIDNLDSRYPGIKARLVHADEVHRFVNIYVNDDDIRFAEGLATAIAPGDKLTVLPAVAGG
ncbi:MULTISPECIES: MoaD/ThiS family protein [Pseudomonas]|uniref:MoaD/ThiS family protein n=1 Tax=Pseudomonas TaxID=286 RepID=UPI000BA3FA9B|nr:MULTISPECIES: MoaD/ThiS family protein [Pseudomonas]MCU1723585.1 MoaD/ThiS family protein [Pseudomonas sp. 5P_5.1_Bac1]MCU1730473.1 MoaD/ThiS family protein [Pseudomonas sp. 20P_3.2_Bac4]MCU1744105.1 MoaD/ThiS family protein [Pseudomonas sp. 20P_3.2_Bac5]